MKGDNLVTFLYRGELGLDFVALGLKPLDRPSKRRRIDARLDDGVDGPVEFTGNLALAPFEFATLVAGVARELPALVVVGFHVLDQVRGLRQFPLHAGKRQVFDIITFDAATVRAFAALAECRALDAIGAVPITGRHHAPAAAAAAKQSGQDAPLLVRAWYGRLPDLSSARRAFACLRCLPEIIPDDPQVRRFGEPPLVWRVRPRDALFRRRVLDHADPVPHDLADVDFVQQQAVPALQVAVDGRGIPTVAAWRCDAGPVQIVRDIPRRLAADVLSEDAPHDLGFGFDNLQLA